MAQSPEGSDMLPVVRFSRWISSKFGCWQGTPER